MPPGKLLDNLPAGPTPLAEIAEVISYWLESVKVAEHIKGQLAWDTTVEVFALVGHPKARRAYAWMMYREGKEDRTVVVLELPPVASAQDAVKVAMARNKSKKQADVTTS